MHTKMDEYVKRAIMNSYRDSFEVGRMYLRSTECINEMRTIVNDEGSIAASGRGKDDRVLAAALAHWIWIQNVKSWLVAERRSFAIENARENMGPNTIGHMQRQVMNYLKLAGISMK